MKGGGPMPLVVSQADLRGLLSCEAELDRVIDAVERSLVDRHAGPAGHALFSDLPLESGDAFKIIGCSAPGEAPTVRIFPWQTVDEDPQDRNVILRFHARTGALETIIASDDINPLRTSVPAAVGARHLAPDGARVLGILGSSTQARGHARMISRAVPSIREILVWSPTPENREAFAAEQASVLGLAVRACDTAEEVVRGGDIVTAAGRTRGGTPAFDAAWVQDGALAISMTHAAPPQLRERAAFVVPTTSRPQLVAFGFASPAGPRPAADPDGVIQLGDVIAGGVRPRQDPAQPVIFELANVYLWDQPIVAWAEAWARDHGRGQEVVLSEGG
jgi:ornithine cyclodeaminase/alanine dehydrogenase-like protein (mu-crystallin family)